MNEAEKRRKKLLEQTRKLYQDNRGIPAVHPRYKVSYYQLYPEQSEIKKGTLGLRCMICMAVFAIYVIMGMNNQQILGINHLQVLETIKHNYLYQLY